MEEALTQILQSLAVKFPFLIVVYNLLPPVWAILKIVAKLTKSKKDDELVVKVESKLKDVKVKK